MKAIKLEGVKPRGVTQGHMFRLDEPVMLSGGQQTNYVVASFGLEMILGEYNTFAVFGCDAEGNVLDWGGIFSEGEGPAWCLELLA